MESHEILKNTIKPVGAKSIAMDMNLSTSLVYKWCEPAQGPDAAGADNPLDRVLRICELTDDCSPIEWLCEKTNGFRADNPEGVKVKRMPVLKSTRAILKEFSDVLEVVSKSYEDDNKIDEGEAKRIRKEWEELKRITESFVSACEKGAYEKKG